MHLHKRKGLRLLAALLACCLFFSALSIRPALAAGFFSDVPPTAWYAGDVLNLVDKGIIQGTGANRFSPGGRLSRGAFAAMLCKTLLTPAEIQQYAFKGSFKDVPQGHWANPYINWAVESGVVKGRGDGTFGPDSPVSRQDLAVMVANFSKATGRKMNAVNPAMSFSDGWKISSYAAASVSACQRAGILNGYTDRTFRPTQTANRAEAASLYARFLNKCNTERYEIVQKRVNGVPVRAVVFDPHSFSSSVMLAQNKITGREGPGSLVSRSGAVIAVNAAFFYMDSYIPIGTMISGGKVLTVDNLFAPAKSAFVMDSRGNCSIENFATRHRAVLHSVQGEAVLENVGFNQKPMVPQDTTRVVFTKDFGTSLTFTARDAVVVSSGGFITQVLHNTDVNIPSDGYVLAQRSRRTSADAFFDTAQVGDRVDLQRSYEGASTQDIKLSIGLGPRIVKNGMVYGNADTYRAEGFKDPGITVYNARRACIGIKQDGKIMLLTANTNLSSLSKIMVSLGCRDAVNCDGGGSTNLFVDGQWLYGPQERKLNHMLVFK